MGCRSYTHREMHAVPKRIRGTIFTIGLAVTAGMLMVALPCLSGQLLAQGLTNEDLSLTVNAPDGSYQLSLHGEHNGQPVLRSRVAAEVDHQWLRSNDYPQHQASESTFEDDLRPGREVTVTCSGLEGKPDLVYVLQLYKQRPYGTVQVKVHNSAGREVTVQAIRSLEVMGEPSVNMSVINLGGGQSAGTTEVQKDFDLKDSLADDQVELSLPVKPGEDIVSERLLFEAGPDYHSQLLAYGDAVRRLHHARVSSETPIGWWSWTVYYGAINQGEVLANGNWQAEHLKSLGYKYFQIT